MGRVKSLGCIVCIREGKGRTPADAHHILRGGRQIDDFHTLPLCFLHHRSGIKTDLTVSRHPWKREFEHRYGNEWTLLKATEQMLAEECGA